MMQPLVLARRALLAAGFMAAMLAPALAADPAETFVAQNIQRGLGILDNKGLSKQQREDQFEQFLLGLTDMKRIADFTLGQYRRTASPADVAAFEAAFQNYAAAVYRSYFSKYAGQTLKVTNSTLRAPTDYIVATQLVDPTDRSSQQPLEVDFRVRTDGPRPVVVDVSVAGVWISLEQRDQFVGFLGQNNGNVKLLITHLSDLAKQFKS
ncbi:MAG: ABC transporter substrate-binding protein [Alphaproteobacteria bacterium]|nr:ABC transporter substrate-binding protein [Alphaproteobacteria bacterium]